MFTSMLVMLRTAITEQVFVFIAEIRHKFKISTGNIDSILAGKAHHTLRTVDAITQHVDLSIHILDQTDRTEMYPDTHPQIGVVIMLIFRQARAKKHR